MKIYRPLKMLLLSAFLLSGLFAASAQDLYLQPVYSDATEVRIINNSTSGIRCIIPNYEGDGVSQPFGYLAYARVFDDPNTFHYFCESDVYFTTSVNQTDSIYPTLLMMMYELTDENHALVTLDSLIGADQLWWSALFYKVDAYGNSVPLDGIGYDDLSYTDGSGLHIVYQFYDIP